MNRYLAVVVVVLGRLVIDMDYCFERLLKVIKFCYLFDLEAVG